MSSIGFGLLKYIVTNKVKISELTENGINEDFFINKEKQAYEYLKRHYLEFEFMPELLTIEREIGEFNCFNNLPNEVLNYWVESVKNRRRVLQMQEAINDIRSLIERDSIRSAVDRIGQLNTDLQFSYTEMQTIDLRKAEKDVIEQHNRIQRSGKMSGIPFGFPYIDAVSGGSQPGDFIAIAGLTGTGKTYLTLQMAENAVKSGNSTLFLCTEMPTLQVARRLLSIEGGFDSTKLKFGKLSYYGMQRVIDMVNKPIYEEDENVFFKLIPGGLYSDIDSIILLAKEHKPKLLVLDGASLIRIKGSKSNKWEKMIEVGEKIKDLAMSQGIAIIATYHFNKTQPGTTEGMYGGLSMGQLASIIFSFEFERREDKDNPSLLQYRLLKLIKGRDGENGTLRVLYDMKKSTITQDRVISGYTNIEENDQDNEDNDERIEVDNLIYEEV